MRGMVYNMNEELRMSPKFQSLGIDRLSVADRLDLAQEIWDSIAAEAQRAPLTEGQRQEIDRRLANHRVNPQDAVAWEQVEAEARARLGR